jgi:hypothetical protein
MLSASQIKSFHDEGYLLVPNALSPVQVKRARECVATLFQNKQGRTQGLTADVYPDIFSRCPEIRWLLLNPRARDILRDLLGEDFVVLRETGAHCQQFGGWHKDTTSQERAGYGFHRSNDYLMVEVAYYLQDNDEVFGGGLDVQPGTHRQPDRYACVGIAARVRRLALRLLSALRRTLGFIAAAPRHHTILSKAGDLVIFDFRINHRATPSLQGNPPPDKVKYAIFIACSRNNQHVARYHDFISKRADYIYLDGFAYPAELLQSCKENGINLS